MDIATKAWSDGYDRGFLAGFKAAQQLKQPQPEPKPDLRGRPPKIFGPAPTTPTQGKPLRVNDVLNRICLSKVTLYRMIAKGTFPKPYKLSERLVVWDEETINNWLAKRKRKGD